ncbi:MAG: hypothetical protein IPL39_25125 [Opitutaceae bacterium]|nr:hypothetical protein [Opitutaceae bacterium]
MSPASEHVSVRGLAVLTPASFPRRLAASQLLSSNALLFWIRTSKTFTSWFTVMSGAHQSIQLTSATKRLPSTLCLVADAADPHRWRKMTLLRKHFAGFLLGALSILVLAEVCPVFTIGFWRLAIRPEFAIGGVGTSPGEHLYLRLRNSFSPECSFVALYHVGNSQAQAYALYGLHEIGSARFPKLRNDFRAKSGTVTMRAGCTTLDIEKKELSYVFEDHTYLIREEKPEANKTPLPTPVERPPSNHGPVPGAADL